MKAEKTTMPRKKNKEEVKVDTKVSETPDETIAPEPTAPAEESEAKKSFRAFVENYLAKRKKDVKYALKEKELLAKLDKMQ